MGNLTDSNRDVMIEFENELGVQDPVGFWDPAGSPATRSSSGTCVPEVSQEDVLRQRVSCVKHIAYFASVWSPSNISKKIALRMP